MGALAIAATATPTLAAKQRIAEPVALVGDTAPTPGGPTFNFPDEPMVDNKGNVVFIMFLSDGNTGVFYKARKSGSPVELISATDVPLLDLGTPDDYDGPTMSRNGHLAFVAFGLTDGPAVLLKRKNKSLEVVAKAGDPAPGTNSGIFDDFNDLAVNNKGHVAFIATYTEDMGLNYKTGVFLSTGQGLMPIVVNGDMLPGTGGTEDGTGDEDIDGPWLNDHDDVAFAVDVINAAPQFEGSVFLKRNKKPLDALLLMGSALPAPVGGTLDSIGEGRPALNNKDVLSFNFEALGGSVNSGIAVVSQKTGILFCALEGDSAPGTTATFSNGGASSPFGNASLSGNNLVFHSDLLGDASNVDGIFACKGKKGKLLKVIATGDPTPPGVSSWLELEEESLSNKWTVFDNEDGSPIGVFIIKNAR
jgi:hypothetical protein